MNLRCLCDQGCDNFPDSLYDLCEWCWHMGHRPRAIEEVVVTGKRL